MVPHKPGALVVGVVILGRVLRRRWIEDLVVQEAQPVRAVRRPPVERPAVADPGDEAAVQMCTAVRFCAWFAPGMVASTGMMSLGGRLFRNVIWIGSPLFTTKMPPRCA